MTRRTLCIASLATLLTAAARTTKADAADPIASIERHAGGRLGVFALDTGSGRTLAHRADERFMLCSTFKGVLAALVLSRAELGQDRLDSMVTIGKGDLLPHSPVSEAHLAAGAAPLGTLCAAIVLYSDNCAANLLLRRVGGPPALTRYVRGLGDETTRFDRYELFAGKPAGLMDTTSPRAISQTARRLLLGDALRQDSRARLVGWMAANETGANRLRARFPKPWTVADKTGTGDGLCNDYAVARHPGRAPLVMAAYYDKPGMDTALQEAVLREVGAAIVRWAEASA